nr:SAM-dependent methyltransferase [uncultured Psychroserpens sp.]
MVNLDESYWDKRYQNSDIGWDLGQVSPPIKVYIDQLIDKNIRILIPGGGHSYEAEYVFNCGFKNVYVVDFSKTALDNIKTRMPHFPSEQLLHQDFFELNMTFDLILEQTFFCALNPKLRTSYVSKMYDLLSEKGKLVGVLFKIPLYENHPPFGGNKAEYLNYFQNVFHIEIFEDCYNSIASRLGKELFFMIKKGAS